MKYDVISADSTEELIFLVNERIEKGWKPQGGIFGSAHSILVYQAMIFEGQTREPGGVE
jgi:hypothetical protein